MSLCSHNHHRILSSFIFVIIKQKLKIFQIFEEKTCETWKYYDTQITRVNFKFI